MSAPAPAHLLIVDPDADLRAALGQYLRRHGFLATLARDGGHAGRILSGLAFDLVILDAGLPEAEAVVAVADCPVLALGGPGKPALGTGQIEPPYEPRDLLARVNTLLGRATPAPAAAATVIRLGSLCYEPARGTLTRAGQPVALTASERELLSALAQKPGEPVARSELAARLGQGGPARARAIDVQVTRLRRKLEANPHAPHHLKTVRGEGYMLVAD